ncbi:MAG: rRNA pseudouridine synthase [Firmicutes bacterium]|nr:rRNA pseudouridine synthase [Bacillota bacterium]
MRINKYLASCGISSRRKSEELVVSGKVKINGRIIKDLSYLVKKTDLVTVDNKKVFLNEKHVYLMLNKPKGFVSTTNDDLGRKTVLDLAPAFRDTRLFPIGRLDYETEGLLLLTTDGDLANKLMHPSHQISKTYVAKIEGEITEEEIKKLESGIVIDGIKTKKSKIRLAGFDTEKKISRLEVIISEGRNRQVRKMFDALNKEVIFLKRTAIGSLQLGGVTRGTYRELNAKEIASLKK